MLDADGSADPARDPALRRRAVTGADFAKGSRFVQGGGSADITLLRRLGQLRARRASSTLLFGTRYTDLCYGYNAFWRDVLPALDLTCDGFEIETLMNIRAPTGSPEGGRGCELRARSNPRVVETPCLVRRLARPQDDPARESYTSSIVDDRRVLEDDEAELVTESASIG